MKLHLHFTLYGNVSKVYYACVTSVLHSVVHEEYILLGYEAILLVICYLGLEGVYCFHCQGLQLP